MTKKIFVFVLLAVFLISAAAMAATSKTMPVKKQTIITGNEPLPPGPVYPLNPSLITESPGTIVGTTHYDYQSNGSSGNRMVVCNDGTRYFAWMNGLNYPTPRHVYFNYIDASGSWFSEGSGQQVNRDLGAGYTQIAAIYGNRAAIAYHSASAGNPMTYSTLAVDQDPPGLGLFDYYDPPDLVSGNRRVMWPYLTCDRNNNIHMLMTESTVASGDPQRLCYTRSTNGGTNWVNPVQFVDTVMTIGGVMASSPVSDKVVMAYSKSSDTASQTWNDIVYILSQDGLSWNFAGGKVNITNYGDDPDSLWAYTDLDVIFDYNDNIHIIWNASWSPTVNSAYFRTYLYHYTTATQQINEITAPYPDSLFMDICGGWNKPICKMNLGVYHEGDINGIFATWTQFDTADVSLGGFGNGDIYMSYSSNNGANWATPQNLTNSPSPGCFPGECDSDHWSSLADVVNDSLHIFYVNDKDAGGVPQTEGANTENPMMYMTYRNPLAPTGIDEQATRPVNFSLLQNYPNPFNSNTVISFELKETSPVKIEVFNVTGAKVTTLVNKEMSAGHHDVTWNAGKFSSGVYYYKLTAGSSTETKQMVYLK